MRAASSSSTPTQSARERVVLAVFEALGLKTVARKRKRAILEQCGFGTRRYACLMAAVRDARVKIVSMGALSTDGLREYAARNGLGATLPLSLEASPLSSDSPPGHSAATVPQSRQAMVYVFAHSEHFQLCRAFRVEVGQTGSSRTHCWCALAEQADELRRLIRHTNKSFCAVTWTSAAVDLYLLLASAVSQDTAQHFHPLHTAARHLSSCYAVVQDLAECCHLSHLHKHEIEYYRQGDSSVPKHWIQSDIVNDIACNKFVLPL